MKIGTPRWQVVQARAPSELPEPDGLTSTVCPVALAQPDMFWRIRNGLC